MKVRNVFAIVISSLPPPLFAAGLIAFAVYLIGSKLDPEGYFEATYILAWILVQASGILAIPCALIGRLLNHDDIRYVNVVTIVDFAVLAVQVLFLAASFAIWCFGGSPAIAPPTN